MRPLHSLPLPLALRRALSPLVTHPDHAVFNEVALLTNSPQACTISAISSCKCFVLHRRNFEFITAQVTTSMLLGMSVQLVPFRGFEFSQNSAYFEGKLKT